jgi:hypothetical protein
MNDEQYALLVRYIENCVYRASVRNRFYVVCGKASRPTYQPDKKVGSIGFYYLGKDIEDLTLEEFIQMESNTGASDIANIENVIYMRLKELGQIKLF